jgi:RND family efflux transporter MFP subunit
MNRLKLFMMLSAIALLFVACGKEKAPAKKIVRPVKTMRVGGIKKEEGRGYPATTAPTQETELSFRVGGPLIKYNVNPGALVHKGALVAAIDPRDFIIAEQSARAGYNQAKAEADRYERLWKKGSVAKNDYDKKHARELETKAAWEDAVNNLKDTKLYTPFGGVYGPKLVEIGQEISPGEPITTLYNLSVIEVVTTIPEQLAVKFKQFESYEVNFDTYPGHTFTARLKELEKNPTPEGFKLHLYLNYKHNSKDLNQPKISSGMSCRVTINLTQDKDSVHSFVIPFAAVFEGETDKTPSVWVIDSETHKVRKQHVELGGFIGKDKVMIVGGLKSGQNIVVAGAKRLIEGQEVKILDQNNFN